MDFTVDRKTWNRGSIHPTELSNTFGMCCLGHCAINMGVSEKVIRGKTKPHYLEGDYLKKNVKQYLEIFCDAGKSAKSQENNALTIRAMRYNDSGLKDDEREAFLVELFKNHNHTIKFIN